MPPEPNKPREQVVSALSIAGIKYKKSLTLAAKKNEDKKPLSRKRFTQEALQDAWKQFNVLVMEEDNKRVMAILDISEVEYISPNLVRIILPTESSKEELLQVQEKLLKYLREHLQNYYIEIEVSVVEAIKKEYAFMPQEKLEKLKKKNPKVEALILRFGLKF